MSIFSKTFMYCVGNKVASSINPVEGKDEFLQKIQRNNKNNYLGKLATVTNTHKSMKHVVCNITGTNTIIEGIGDVQLKIGDTVQVTKVYTVAGFPRIEVEIFT